MTIIHEHFGEGVYSKRYVSISYKMNSFIVKYYDDGSMIGTYMSATEKAAEDRAEEFCLGYLPAYNPDEHQGGVEYF
tara:strand:- start:2128 stop:2358 length:231 start_codon:yes stop_codon:yes gene_type:complete